MTKRNSNQGGASRSLLGGLGAIIIVILAALMTLFGDGGGAPTPTPSQAAPPTAVVTTVPPTTIRGGTPVANAPDALTLITVPQGFGAQKGFWQVFFTAPTGSRDRATYTAGIDTQLAAAINSAQSTLDIAAFEFNNPMLTRVVLDAKTRGVRVRMVTDNEHGLHDEQATINQFIQAGIPVVDDGRSALMHNKFMIIDSSVVWTGSWNYTINDTYRNNNNAIALRSQRAVQAYQAEFDEMFTQKEFGPGRRIPSTVSFTQDGVRVQIFFAPEDRVVPAIVSTVNGAQRSIKFMAFSFTLDEIATAIKARAANGVEVRGIFETTGSETRFSELSPLFCAGLQVRQDGNPFILHHKVFIIDDQIVLTGSFNFSSSATDSNDENMIIVQDSDLAAQYTAEFERRWAESRLPSGLNCQ